MMDPSDDPPLQQQQQQQQQPAGDEEEEEEEETCAVCLEPLRLQILEDGSRVPIDDRLLFHPSQCHPFHGFHLQCAKSVAKSEQLEERAAGVIGCPVCRKVYLGEDLRRLLPPPKLVSFRVRVDPVDDTSQYDLFLWERYDPNCRYPRNPAERLTGLRQIVGRRFRSAILPRDDPDQQQQQQQPPPLLDLSDGIDLQSEAVLGDDSEYPIQPPAAEPPATNISILRELLNDEIARPRRSNPLSVRLLEHFVRHHASETPTSTSSSTSSAISVFLQSATAHGDMNRALKSLDQAVHRLRLRRVRRRLDFGGPSTGRSINNTRRSHYKNAILTRIETKLVDLREKADGLASDLWEYGLTPHE